MNLDGLVRAINQTSRNQGSLEFSDLLSSWKDDKSDVQELDRTVEQYLSKTWITCTDEHENIYRLWSEFRNDAINKIGGMTVNESLYRFSLFPRWDNATTDNDRKIINAKLQAFS